MNERRFEEGERVPDGLFCVDGERSADLYFEVPVRVVTDEDGRVRHVYPDRAVHGVIEVVSARESTPHTTIFEGPNTVLYFDPDSGR